MVMFARNVDVIKILIVDKNVSEEESCVVNSWFKIFGCYMPLI